MKAIGKTLLAQSNAKVKACGKPLVTVDPLTGQQSLHLFQCKKFRECYNCLKSRAEKEHERIFRGMNKAEVNFVYIVFGDIDEIDAVAKVIKKHKSQFRRYPMQNDHAILHITPEAPGEIFTLDEIDFERLVKTADGARLSGVFGKHDSSEEEEGDSKVDDGVNVLVTAKAIYFDAPEDITDYAWGFAVSQIKRLFPVVDISNIIQAVTAIMELYRSEMLEVGYKDIFSTTLCRRVYESSIHWASFGDKKANIVNTRGLRGASDKDILRLL